MGSIGRPMSRCQSVLPRDLRLASSRRAVLPALLLTSAALRRAPAAAVHGVPILIGRLGGAILAIRLPALRAGAYLFWGSATLYLMLAIFLVLQLHLIVGDAWSRVGNAYYVLFSRDPHLAAVGFVWNPLPSIVEMPLVLLHGLWPPLVQQGFAASIVSAAAMAGAVYVLHGILLDWGVARAWRIGLAVLFALHPMVLHYGANGDTEALYLLLMLLAVRHLSRWLASGRLGPLVMAGLALGLGYWTRYETIAAAAAVIGVVSLISYRRWSGSRRERLTAAVADAIIVGAPFVVAFGTWTLASWIIVGNAFEQFSSVYGTASQLSTGNVFDGGTLDAVNMASTVLRGLEPALLILLPLSLVWAAVRRDARWFAPLSVLGGILAFAVLAWVMGKTGGWIRYYIAVIPLTVLLSGLLVSTRARDDTTEAETEAQATTSRWAPVRGWLRAGALALVGFAVLVGNAAALPTALDTMRDPTLGRGEHNKLDDLPQYLTGAAVSQYVDQMDLGDGDVLVDVFLGFPIVLESSNPRQFVITTDRDFKAVVTDPQIFDVRYILVPPTGGLGSLDAIKRQWPGIYESGGAIGTLVHEFRVPGTSEAFRWRLYAVEGPGTEG
jgi:hypothetical protein